MKAKIGGGNTVKQEGTAHLNTIGCDKTNSNGIDANGSEGTLVARITAEHRDRYDIVCEKGAGHARLRAGRYFAGGEVFPTTGDYVTLSWQEAGDSRIESTLPRKTVFLRSDPTTGHKTEQAVAANFDTAFILQSLNHDFNPRRLERYLALAWQSGAEPVVVLTKADVAEARDEKLALAEKTATGARVYVVSAKTGEGLDELKPYFGAGKTVVFLGSSGVGKSSLVNALAGAEVMSTGEIREDDSRGRHTTTYRQLIALESGAMIIDTPGMRELGMWDISEGLGASFAEIEELSRKCRFRDCRHRSEPGCAILAAIEDGRLSRERYESYLGLAKEAKYTAGREQYLREKRARNKALAMEHQTKR